MVSMDFSAATEAFVGWLNDGGFEISAKIKVEDLRQQNQGRGMVAVEDIAEGEELFGIPREATFSARNNTLVRRRSDLANKIGRLSGWEGLIIVLLYELKVVGDDSGWKRYFDVLPVNDRENYRLNQLMFWLEQELGMLQPSLIVERVGKDLAESMFYKLYPRVIVEEFGLKELEGITIEDFHMVASLIMSYSFDIVDYDGEINGQKEAGRDSESDSEKEDDEEEVEEKSIKSMVPLADTLNADTTSHNASLEDTPERLAVISIKDIKKGEQIYNSYFEHPNSEILRRYGYVEEGGSLHDFGEVPLSLIESYFITTKGVPQTLVKTALTILSEVASPEEDEDELVKIVLDSYDCFKSSEVIIEFIFIIQVLTIISLINALNPMEVLDHNHRADLIRSIYKRCYKLIDSKKLSEQFLKNYTAIITERLNQYPDRAKEPFQAGSSLDRGKMAEVVLRSEFQSLKSCLDTEKVFQEGYGISKFISDEKIIASLAKKRFYEEDPFKQTNGNKKTKTQ